ncbi:MAG: hypothetical protein LBC51_05910 [Treponema sp.]|jgi:hypothetical protein|nr:hypothetical protein [Treponema sp.]
MADKIGLNLGLYGDGFYLWGTDTQDYFLSPRVSYDHSFGLVDLYVRGEYTFCLTKPFPQFFFSEERIAARLPVTSLGALLFTVQNENDILINPEEDTGAGSGTLKPELGYGMVLPLGEVSLTAGFPWTYSMWGAGDVLFGLDATAAYTTPFWLGFKATVNFILIPDAACDGMEVAINFLQDQFYAELAFKAKEAFGYFSLIPEFDYSFNFFTFWVSVEFGNLGYGKTLSIAPTLGISYRF